MFLPTVHATSFGCQEASGAVGAAWAWGEHGRRRAVTARLPRRALFGAALGVTVTFARLAALATSATVAAVLAWRPDPPEPPLLTGPGLLESVHFTAAFSRLWGSIPLRSSLFLPRRSMAVLASGLITTR